MPCSSQITYTCVRVGTRVWCNSKTRNESADVHGDVCVFRSVKRRIERGQSFVFSRQARREVSFDSSAARHTLSRGKRRNSVYDDHTNIPHSSPRPPARVVTHIYEHVRAAVMFTAVVMDDKEPKLTRMTHTHDSVSYYVVMSSRAAVLRGSASHTTARAHSFLFFSLSLIIV